jgi:hypothetical protein
MGGLQACNENNIITGSIFAMPEARCHKLLNSY